MHKMMMAMKRTVPVFLWEDLVALFKKKLCTTRDEIAVGYINQLLAQGFIIRCEFGRFTCAH